MQLLLFRTIIYKIWCPKPQHTCLIFLKSDKISVLSFPERSKNVSCRIQFPKNPQKPKPVKIQYLPKKPLKRHT